VKVKLKIFLVALGVLISGCASTTPQVDKFFEKSSPLSAAYQITNVPFINHSEGYCGPATLTMALNWAGENVAVENIAPQVFTPGMKGSLQTDMLVAVRRQGLVATPVESLDALLTEVSAGHPVIVFVNLGVKWIPTWHYAIVTGYDLEQKKIIMHSGPEQNKREDIYEFERSWLRGDYWGFTVLRPGTLAATASELTHARAVASIEKLGHSARAADYYRSILTKWPDSLGAHIGLANLAFAQNKPAVAVRHLKHAVKKHPESEAAKHNLEVALRALSK